MLTKTLFACLWLGLLIGHQSQGIPVSAGGVKEDEIAEVQREAEETEEEEEIDKAMEVPGLFEGDIEMYPGMEVNIHKNKQKRDTISHPVFRWPGGVLYYQLDPALNDRARKAVTDAFQHISSQTCITFVERTTQSSYVRIFPGSGCYSNIGRNPRNAQQDLSLGRGCEHMGVAAHELYHALGFFHEQSRLDRDDYITVNFANIQQGRENNFAKYQAGSASDIGAPYDLESLMHYGRRAFSRTGGDTITPKNPSARIGQRRALSPIDIWQLNKLYQCSGTPATPPPAPYGGGKVPTNPPAGDECVVHTEINDASRSVESGLVGGVARSDRGFITTKWYRFVGPAGTTLPNSCPSTRRCGAQSPGWLSGSHPSVGEGTVSRKACFHWNNDCCNWQQDIEVRNCGKFYVYRLQEPPNFYLRYCVSQGGGNKIECTFENEICGMSNIGGDNFDWTKKNGRTASSNTGPSTDATTKSASGYYMYIETSSPRVPNDVARLASPLLCTNASVTARGCARFSYHMYGATIGSLNVKVDDKSIWSKTGNQGDQWLTAAVPFQAKQCFQVTFEGVRGASFTGDIALDDIVIESDSSNCTPPPTTSPPQVYRIDCTFEQGVCLMQDEAGDDFEWTRQTGSTRSRGTGPTAGHITSQGSGYYLYTEASYPRQPGDVARLVSPELAVKNDPNQSNGCIQFWYHMYGGSMGTLNVKVNGNVVWTKSGDQGNQWRRAAQIFQANGPYKVTIESIRGSNWQSDVAIDDLVIQTGSTASCT